MHRAIMIDASTSPIYASSPRLTDVEYYHLEKSNDGARTERREQTIWEGALNRRNETRLGQSSGDSAGRFSPDLSYESFTRHMPGHHRSRTGPATWDYSQHQSSPSCDQMKQKKLLIKSAILYDLNPDTLRDLLQALDQYSTRRCCWKLALLSSQLTHLSNHKHLRVAYEEIIHSLSDSRYRQTIETVPTQQCDEDLVSLQEYAGRQLDRDSDILKYFIVTEKDDRLYDSSPHIVSCTLDEFLDQYLISL